MATLNIDSVAQAPAGGWTSGDLADNAVTTAKIAATAVTTAKIAAAAVTTNELGAAAVTTPKIAAAAVTTNELGAAAVTTAKIADNAVDTSKATKSVKRNPYLTNSNEATATTEAEIKNFTFNKASNFDWSDFAVAAEIKTSSAAQAATLLVYIDAEGTARASVTTAATAYDVQATADIDISDLAAGNHAVKIKLKSADGVATASNKKLDFFLVRA